LKNGIFLLVTRFSEAPDPVQQKLQSFDFIVLSRKGSIKRLKQATMICPSASIHQVFTLQALAGVSVRLNMPVHFLFICNQLYCFVKYGLTGPPSDLWYM